MGLFGLLKGGNKKSVEYYLQQRSSRTLMEVFKNDFLKPYIVGDCPERPCWVSGGRNVEETGLTSDEEGAEKIPRSFYNKYVNAKLLLEIVKERNDEYSSEAAFYLATLYEHCMCGCFTPESADGLYKEAKLLAQANNPEGKNHLLEAVEFVKSNMLTWDMYSDDKKEMLIHTIFHYLDKNHEKNKELLRMLDFKLELEEELAKLCVVVMARYAEIGKPFTLAVFGTTLVQSYSSPEKISELFRDALRSVSSGNKVGAGNNLINKCIDIYHKGGKMGEYAHNILVDLNIKNIN